MGFVPALYTLVIAVGILLVTPKRHQGLAVRIALAWAAAAAAAFLIPQRGAALFILGVMLVAIAPSAAADRTRFYVATFFALPQGYAVAVPFPGLNFLVALDFGLLSGLCVLGPVLARQLGKPGPKSLRALDVLVIAYCVLMGLLALRDVSFTSGIRHSVVTFITIWLPYYCVTRTQTSREDFERMLSAALQGFAMLAGIGIVSVIDSWNYYGNLGDGDYKLFSDYRFGILRVAATLYTPLLGALMGVGAATIAYLHSQKKVSSLMALAFLGAFAFTAFATGSRGGWVGSAVALATYLVLPGMTAVLRRLCLFGSAVALCAVVAMVVQGSLEVTDATGTFEYRARLTQVGIRQILDAPMFGVSSLYELPEFQPLIQGEGIIDVVNLYLQIALFSGLVGLTAFLGPVLISTSLGLRALALSDARRKEENVRRMRQMIGVGLGMMTCLLVMSATTSARAYLYTFFFLTTAMLAASSIAMKKTLSETQILPQAPADSEAPLQKSAPVKLPYGVRLVRRD